MALDSAEHIAITQAFIYENPHQVVITRQTKVSDGAGGFVVSGETTLPAQTMRLVGIEPRRGHTLVMSVTRDGEQVMASSSLICLPDADIENQDQFIVDGDTSKVYEVLTVENQPGWRLRVEVYLHAS